MSRVNKSDGDIERDLARVKTVIIARSRQESRRHRRAVIGGVAIGGILLGGALTAGSIAIATASSQEIEHNVVCYEAAAVDSRTTEMSTVEGYNKQTGETSSTSRLDPLGLCDSAWKMGLVGQPQPPVTDPNDANFPIPKLAICVRPDGLIAGIPAGEMSASETCDALNFKVWVNQAQ